MENSSVKVNWGGGVVKDYTLNPLSCETVEHDYAAVSRLPRTITITGAANVTILGCPDNALTALTLTDCTSLRHIGCYNNLLTSLDLRGCPALEVLACTDNRLINLNVSGCHRLITLSCHTNRLTSLALKAKRTLTTVPQATGTLATRLKPSEPTGGLRLPIEIDDIRTFRRDPDIRDLFPPREITPIPFPLDEPPNRERPLPSLSGEFPNMQYLYCHHNQLTELDVTGCIGLEKIWCNNNKLTSLTIAGLPNLEFVGCHHNLLREVNVDGCFSLEKMHCLSGQKNPFSITGLTQQNSAVLVY